MDDTQTNGKLFDPAKRKKLFSPDRMKRFPPAAFLAALRPWQGIRYADLGAGTGYYTIPVLDAVAGVGRFTAVDLSPIMLEDSARSSLTTRTAGACSSSAALTEKCRCLPPASTRSPSATSCTTRRAHLVPD